MVDSVQRTSTIPLPAFQTEQGAQNPLPLNAPKEEDRLDDLAKTGAQEKQADRFEDYLNQSSITTVEKVEERRTQFDPAAEIAAGSVYASQSGKQPF